MNVNAIASVSWGLAYTISVFAAGLGLNHPLSWKAALLTMGLAFFSHVSQLVHFERAAMAFVFGSWATAAIAGIALVF